MDALLFWIFAAVAVVASLLVVGQRNPMYSVLLLIVSFGALSGLYVLLDAPFVAVIQIIIYAGAIMVLFLFVVMLLNVPTEDPPTRAGHARFLGGAGPAAVRRACCRSCSSSSWSGRCAQLPAAPLLAATDAPRRSVYDIGVGSSTTTRSRSRRRRC